MSTLQCPLLAVGSTGQQMWLKAFVDGMQAVGWIDGGNVRLDVRWGGVAADRMQRLATELVDLQPDVVFTMTTPLVKAVLGASRTVPDRIHPYGSACGPSRHFVAAR